MLLVIMLLSALGFAFTGSFIAETVYAFCLAAFILTYFGMLRSAIFGPVYSGMIGGPPIVITFFYTLVLIPAIMSDGFIRGMGVTAAALYFIASLIICFKYPIGYAGEVETMEEEEDGE